MDTDAGDDAPRDEVDKSAAEAKDNDFDSEAMESLVSRFMKHNEGNAPTQAAMVDVGSRTRKSTQVRGAWKTIPHMAWQAWYEPASEMSLASYLPS